METPHFSVVKATKKGLVVQFDGSNASEFWQQVKLHDIATFENTGRPQNSCYQLPEYPGVNLFWLPLEWVGNELVTPIFDQTGFMIENDCYQQLDLVEMRGQALVSPVKEGGWLTVQIRLKTGDLFNDCLVEEEVEI